jgi:N-acetylneuraminic acid mutarotase
MSKLRFCHVTLVIFICVYLVACGGSHSTPIVSTGGPGSSGTSGSSTPDYSLGGNVSGLAGSGLVLQNNGTDNLAVSKAGSFTFPTKMSSGSAYKVTVLTQPSDPTQICAVTNGSGTIKANVTVQVSCTTVTFNIAGSVQGLVGVGLVLQDNLSDSLTISSNGSFTFPTAIAGGTAFDVTVLEQPVTPAQICSPSNATGTANAAVTTVKIVCVDDIPVGDWNWIGGADIPNQLGSYGTTFTPSAGNIPGARFNAVTWTDAAGNFWLFGGNGYGYDSGTNGFGLLNDFWKYHAGEWTAMGGSDTTGQSGVYGTPQVASADNIPGARESAVSWVDAAGNFWLFGGSGPDSTGFVGYMNDLWEYSGGKWNWLSGSNLANQSGNYGTKGVASAANAPPSRSGAVEWTDAAGNFWIFGGFGIDSSGGQGSLSDLWKYSAGQWTWMGGSDLSGQAGIYGTQGVPAASNMPGGRNSAMGWIDAAGNFWLFGGMGLDSTDKMGDLNDMWKYSGGEWTWVCGSNLEGQMGTYGTQGVAASTNVPGSRDSSLAMTDAAGNFWVFGGNGLASTTVRGGLNDMWKFSAGQWTWMSGSNAVNEAGTYGTLSTPSAENLPGGRGGPSGRIDAAGGFWIFAGEQGLSTQFNDLWMYQP